MSATASALWWLSFCDGTRPKGQQLLGACIVSGENLDAAVASAHVNGVNPGGEVVGCPTSGLMARLVPAARIGVLMDSSQCEAFDREMINGW